MTYKYAFKDYDEDSMARSALSAASVSTKHCVEIANALRGKKVERAHTILDEAISIKKAIPFLRFKKNIGHKKGIGPGRYPVKACGEVLLALNACEANALAKGLNTDGLKIIHISAHMASRPWHYGRARRRKMKRTHIEIVLEETVKLKRKPGKKDKAPKKSAEEKKADASIVEKKVAPKDKPGKKDKAPKKSAEEKKVDAPIVEKKVKPRTVNKPELPVKPKIVKDGRPAKSKVTKDEPKKDTVAKD